MRPDAVRGVVGPIAAICLQAIRALGQVTLSTRLNETTETLVRGGAVGSKAPAALDAQESEWKDFGAQDSRNDGAGATYIADLRGGHVRLRPAAVVPGAALFRLPAARSREAGELLRTHEPRPESSPDLGANLASTPPVSPVSPFEARLA